MQENARLFEEAIRLIDASNSQDPSRESVDGAHAPAALLYSQRMSAWLARLDPSAPDALKLAVRCQHLRRWEIPRSTYPMTRAGYHQWRTKLAHFHADQAAAILESVGYDPATVARVRSLIRKERIKSDPEAQTLEDAACLVFLEFEYVQFARQHEGEKVIDILRKTWRKMSAAGHAAAMRLAEILPEAEKDLVVKAVSGT